MNRQLLAKVVAALVGAVLVVGLAPPAQARQESSTPFLWAQSTVYVRDHTTRWPVAAAVKAWNRAGSGVRLVYTRDCRGLYPCVHVRGRRDAYEAIGVSTAGLYDGHMVANDVVMNRRYNYYPYRVRLGAVTHELGHVLGLTHDTRRRSIMYYRNAVPWPSSYDLRLLRRLYR